MILADSFDEPAELRLVGRDAPVNTGARSPRDISANNSPTLARNPRRRSNLAVANRIDTPFFACALHVSFDGGKSWSRTPIPAPKGEEPKCFAPDLIFTRDGMLHLSFVTLRGRGNVPHAVWVVNSSDGGRTLSKPRKAQGPLAFQVRLSPDTVRRNRFYMTWLQGKDVGPLKFTTNDNPVMMASSDDGGASWSEPRRVSEGRRARVVTPAPVVGPKGELYVLYLDLGDDRLDYAGGHGGRGGEPYAGRYTLIVTRSLDGGRTWAESVVDRRVRPIHRFVVFFPPAPSIAVDSNGRIYVAFHDARDGDADAFLWTLDAGKNDWRGPKRINDTPPGDGRWQYLPKLSVAPDGRLDALYYDRRFDRRNVQNQVSLQSSFDHGETFTPALQLASRTFDSRIGFGAKEGLPDLGSRLGLVSEDRFALGLWTDTRAGTTATQKQDLAAAVVAVTEPEPLSETTKNLFRYGGALLALAGVALLGLWLMRRLPFVRQEAG